MNPNEILIVPQGFRQAMMKYLQENDEGVALFAALGRAVVQQESPTEETPHAEG